jgi:3-methyladenine DNA glycosylase AlkD
MPDRLADTLAALEAEASPRFRADLGARYGIVTDRALGVPMAHAFAKVDEWAALPDELGRRAAFALLASLALHGGGSDADFLARLPLIEAVATDERNFVKKGVNWALRAIGGQKSPALRQAARDLADRLTQSPDKTARWIGKDAQKAFAKADLRPFPTPDAI